MQLVDLAIAGDGRFSSSDIELTRNGQTYAIDTVRQLLSDNPENKYFWIVGADALVGMPTWHDFSELKQLIEIVAVNRTGINQAKVDFDYTFVQIPEIDISATEIRARVKAGKEIKYLVPAEVERLIKDSGLYK